MELIHNRLGTYNYLTSFRRYGMWSHSVAPAQKFATRKIMYAASEIKWCSFAYGGCVILNERATPQCVGNLFAGVIIV